MCPADIEEVKRLCQRIVEEQDPQSFSSLVEELNKLLEDDGEQNRPNTKGHAACYQKHRMAASNGVVHSMASLVYELRTTHPRTLRQSRSGS